MIEWMKRNFMLIVLVLAVLCFTQCEANAHYPAPGHSNITRPHPCTYQYCAPRNRPHVHHKSKDNTAAVFIIGVGVIAIIAGLSASQSNPGHVQIARF